MRDPETPCVIDATFHDWRTVKGRKMLQLVFEIPIEKQGEVLTLLGHPEPSGSKWCMIALKDVGKPAQARGAENAATIAAKRAEDKPGRSLAERVAILCNDKRFRDWLGKTWGGRLDHAADADAEIKAALFISSKTELNAGSPNYNAEAAANVKLLIATYEASQLDERYADVRRP